MSTSNSTTKYSAPIAEINTLWCITLWEGKDANEDYKPSDSDLDLSWNGIHELSDLGDQGSSLPLESMQQEKMTITK